jgi:hypothetical protein
MYCSQSKDGHGDFASITIKDGCVEFRFDTGSGPAILRSGVPINAGAWYTVYVERKLRDGILKLSTGDLHESNRTEEVTGISTTVTGKSPGSTRGLNIRTSLYFGGIDEYNKYVPAESVGVKHGFSGCIDDLRVGGLRRSGIRGRHGRTGSNTNPRRKIMKVDIEKSIVDSSNIINCDSISSAINYAAPQPIKGKTIFRRNRFFCYSAVVH